VSFRWYLEDGATPGHAAPAPVVMDHLRRMSLGATIVVGAVIGLAIGILVSVATDLPLAPEVGLVLGGLVGWRLRRDSGAR
jgi:hypothetical protein